KIARSMVMVRPGIASLFLFAVSGGLHAAPDADILGVFQSNCIECHGKGDKVKGKVNLLEIHSLDQLKKNPDLLGKIVEAIDFEEMPPEDEPQLASEARKGLLSGLETLLDESLAESKVYPQAPIRRMTRFQYDNAVTDLFDLHCTVFTLPERMMRNHRDYFKPETGKMAEVVTVGNRPLGKSQMIEPRLAGVTAYPQDLRAEHGYDNQGDHLSLSPLLMEAFLKLGQSIVQSPDFNQRRVGLWKSFFAPPHENEDLSKVVPERLEHLLKKAFRRPIEASQLKRYSNYVLGQLERGTDFTSAMKAVSAAIISSPKFLYLYDGVSGEETMNRVDGYDLASRLSFFLWGSLPDDELLELAAAGTLLNDDVLDAQIYRMLKDRKVKRFCDSFPSQWLQLERIISSVPDPKKFPRFYFSQYRNSMHMLMEPLLLFETVLIENMSITQFLDSNFTYRSGHLEQAYGALGAPGEKKKGEVGALTFHRVPVEDRRNGGIITNAAVMTMTSGPERTQPITRGAWLAGVIFNNPPEPPPANVPSLGEKPKEGEEHLTLRERLSMHRERSDCRGCHEQIDPLGFALENYNAVGNWREKYENGREVDMQGTLFRKHDFQNVTDFKDAILEEKDRFSRGLAGHLLSFSLGRELGVADAVILDEIADTTAKDGYRFKSLIREVVKSEPFLTKTNPKKIAGP
ncbi:DUF1592 domain-containing protein, partial [Akkermansiaceae bacterium]|nr:DUF1592 domain-containing protein [Akkermansiaceae bacterium]